MHELSLVNRKSVAFKWLFSYISILIVPLIISGAIYARFSSDLRNEINSANSALLRQVKNDMDNKLLDMRRLATQIGLNHQVRMLMLPDGGLFGAEQYNRLMQDFRVYRVANSAVDDFYILLPGRELTLTPSTVLRGQLSRNLLDRFTTVDGAPLEGLLGARHTNELLPLRQTLYGGEHRELITLLQSLPLDKQGGLTGTLMVVMAPDQLTKTLENIQWLDHGVVLVLDEKDHVLASNAPFGLPDSLRYANLAAEEQLYSFQDEKGVYTVAHARSDVTGWKYVSIVPDEVLWRKADAIRRFTVIGVLCSLALGCVMATLFVRNNYVPVRKLVGVLAEKAGIGFDQDRDEFRFIEEAVSSALGQKQADTLAIDRQLLHLRRSFAARLLKGGLETSFPLQEALNLYKLHFISEDFRVLVFYISAITGGLLKAGGPEGAGRGGQFEQDELQLSRYVLCNVFEELFGRFHLAVMVTVDGLQALLLNLSPDRDDPDGDIGAALGEGVAFVSEKFGIQLSVSKSAPHRTLEEVPDAYIEAYTAMEYNILMGKTGVTDYGHIELGLGGDNNSYFYYYPLKVEVQFTNFIKAGDYSSAKKVLDVLFDTNFRQYHLPGAIVRCFMFNLTSTMLKTIYELADMTGGEPADADEVERLLGCQTVADLELETNRLLIQLCGYARRKSHAGSPARQAAAIVRSCYADPTLSVAQIAERVGITSSYLSKKFREEFGVGLLDYIAKSRVEAAKRLLTESTKTVQEIAGLCGFVNDNMLIRAFKKQEGITPGKYREIR